MADDIITQADKQAKANHEELIRLRIVNAALHDEIARLRDIIKQAAELLDSYGDGGTVWTEEMDIINMVQKEARRG